MKLCVNCTFIYLFKLVFMLFYSSYLRLFKLYNVLYK